MKLFVNFFAVLLLLVVACDPGEYKPPELGSDYFPLKKGFYQIYSVQNIDFEKGESPDTTEYEMLVEVVDSFPTTSQEVTYVIHRSTRATSGEDWTPLDTWSARKNDRELVVNEGNISYLKLVFPVREGSRWNGNKYNSLQADEYEIVNLHESFELQGGITFDHTLTVEEGDNADPDYILFLDLRKDVYAKDFGMIYKETVQLHYCYADDSCKGQQIIENGVKNKMWLKEYGME